MKQKAFKDYASNSERYTQITTTLLAAGFTHVDMTIFSGSIEITLFAHTLEERFLGEGILNGFLKKGEKRETKDSENNGETFWIIQFIHPIN